jgi:hypothetical protein
MCQKLKANELEIIILPDGRVRLSTGSFAGAAHASADAFVRTLMAELGVVVEERVSLGHTHTHDHAHEHAKAGAK